MSDHAKHMLIKATIKNNFFAQERLDQGTIEASI